MKYTIWIVVSGLVLAGCGDGNREGLESGFAPASSTGTIGKLDQVYIDNVITSPIDGDQFAYEVGAVRGEGFQAYAGFLPGAEVVPPPTTGTATYNGAFFVGFMADVTRNDDEITGVALEDIGAITMDIDFGGGTMTASGTGIVTESPFFNGNAFNAEGTFTGTEMTGTVTYNGVSGPMQGMMGADEAMGVFHGLAENQVHAGGFGAN